MAEKPKIVTLCGSSRFVDIMAVCAWLIERDEGAIAQTLHLLPGWYCAEHIPDHLAEHEGCATDMDALHFRKIELSDEIFVVNREDYIGESTSNEIAHAQALGKPIRWYTHDPVGERVEELLIAAIERAQKRERPWLEKWRKATGQDDVLPGYGKLLAWICDRAEAAEVQVGALVDEAEQAIKWQQFYMDKAEAAEARVVGLEKEMASAALASSLRNVKIGKVLGDRALAAEAGMAARDTRGLELTKVLSVCLTAMNPPDRNGISMHEWNQRLKVATKQACAVFDGSVCQQSDEG